MPINEVERKLAEYRAKKERESRINHYKAQVNIMLSKFIKKKDEKNEEENRDTDSKEALLKEENYNIAERQESDANLEIEPDNEQSFETLEEDTSLSFYDYIYYTLWFILWITIFAIFIKLQFGTIYLIVSGIIGMYLNTRTGPKKKNEISAYSVFNKNCESIDGTLKGEQLTREMLYGGIR